MRKISNFFCPFVPSSGMIYKFRTILPLITGKTIRKYRNRKNSIYICIWVCYYLIGECWRFNKNIPVFVSVALNSLPFSTLSIFTNRFPQSRCWSKKDESEALSQRNCDPSIIIYLRRLQQNGTKSSVC